MLIVMIAVLDPEQKEELQMLVDPCGKFFEVSDIYKTLVPFDCIFLNFFCFFVLFCLFYYLTYSCPSWEFPLVWWQIYEG